LRERHYKKKFNPKGHTLMAFKREDAILGLSMKRKSFSTIWGKVSFRVRSVSAKITLNFSFQIKSPKATKTQINLMSLSLNENRKKKSISNTWLSKRFIAKEFRRLITHWARLKISLLITWFHIDESWSLKTKIICL
jgi:hypothetical protein